MVLWLTFSVFQAAIIFQGWLAYRDGFFWPSQVRRRVKKGLSFFAHGGMWGDFLIISPAVADIVADYGAEWSAGRMTGAGFLGLFASLGMHETYKKAEWPEAHVRGGFLTAAGWVHVFYMAAAFSVLGLYYFFAPYSPYMWKLSAMLIFHVVLGNHMVVGLFLPELHPGEPLKSAQGWGAIIGAAVLTLGVTALRYFRVF